MPHGTSPAPCRSAPGTSSPTIPATQQAPSQPPRAHARVRTSQRALIAGPLERVRATGLLPYRFDLLAGAIVLLGRQQRLENVQRLAHPLAHRVDRQLLHLA